MHVVSFGVGGDDDGHIQKILEETMVTETRLNWGSCWLSDFFFQIRKMVTIVYTLNKVIKILTGNRSCQEQCILLKLMTWCMVVNPKNVFKLVHMMVIPFDYLLMMSIWNLNLQSNSFLLVNRHTRTRLAPLVRSSIYIKWSVEFSICSQPWLPNWFVCQQNWKGWIIP